MVIMIELTKLISKISYVYPNGTQMSNRMMNIIYSESNASIRNVRLSSKVQFDNINISWGYLGLTSCIYLQSHSKIRSLASQSCFTLDHAFGPPDLKRKLFRISRLNQTLDPVIFADSLLDDADKDLIYKYLRMLVSSEFVDLTIPPFFRETLLQKEKSLSLLIKRSPVLYRLKSSTDDISSSWLKTQRSFFRNSSSAPLPLIAIKASEPVLTRKGYIKQRKINLIKVKPSYASFAEVLSPFSMFSVPFMLHSIPVYLSSGHPFYPIIGGFIPSLSPHEAIDLLISSMERCFISLNKFSKMEATLQEMCKYQ